MMGKARLEAFTDGVFAIIVTIMVLELRLPRGSDVAAVMESLPAFAAYVLSFINVAIFWNNHHHVLHLARHVDGRVLWANLALLFWLSLVPFVIKWVGEVGLVTLPVAAYGVVLVMAGVAYYVLERTIVARNGGRDSALARALGSDLKGKLSIVLYALAVPSAAVEPWVAIALYVFVALVWLVPDRRIERMSAASQDGA